MADKRNSEGYWDPTAYLAERKIELSQRRRTMEIKRGDIWYVDSIYGVGSEQTGGRPAIVVSNDMNNRNSEVVEVVYLTCKPKADLPTHVSIRSSSKESTALCEQITAVSTTRLNNYKGHCTNQEMSALVIAMMISLGLEAPTPKKVEKADIQKVEPAPQKQEVQTELEETVGKEEAEKYKETAQNAAARCRVFEELYHELLDRVLEKTV